MTPEAFEQLCTLRDQLIALGLESYLDLLADDDEDAVEAALQAALEELYA